MEAKDPKAIYRTKLYEEFNPLWHIKDSPWKCRKMLQAIPGGLEFGGTLKILDIGCGVGEILRLFSEEMEKRGAKAQCYGYDISPHAIREAQKNFPEGKFRCKEFSGKDFKGLEIDIALLIDILEHLENPGAMLRELRPRAKYLIVHLPLEDNMSLRMRKGELKEREKKMGHIHHFNHRSALDLLGKDFEVLRHIYTCFDVDGDYKYGSRLNNLVGRPLRKVLYSVSPRLMSKTLGCSMMVFLRSRDYRVRSA